MNLTATPGLGSLMCRRRVPGLGQLTLSVTGFCLIMFWMLKLIYRATMQQTGDVVPEAPATWLWHWGGLLFAAAWLWSLVTSLSLWREIKTLEQTAATTAPPHIGTFKDRSGN